MQAARLAPNQCAGEAVGSRANAARFCNWCQFFVAYSIRFGRWQLVAQKNCAKFECPLLAQSGHAELHCACPLSGVKRTWVRAACAVTAFHSTLDYWCWRPHIRLSLTRPYQASVVGPPCGVSELLQWAYLRVAMDLPAWSGGRRVSRPDCLQGIRYLLRRGHECELSGVRLPHAR